VPPGGPDDDGDPRGERAEDGPGRGAADTASAGDQPERIPGLAAGFRPDPVPGPGEQDEPDTGPGDARRAGRLPWPGQAPRADRPAGPDTGNQGSQDPRTGPPRRSEPGQPGQRGPDQRGPDQRRPEQGPPGTGQRPGPGRRSDSGIVPGMSGSNDYDEYGRRRTARALPPAPVSVSAIAGRTWGQVRHHPLEAVAVVWLILSVLIFPPLWLLGVFIALLSRLWNPLDKLIGLAGPALLAIIGTGIGLAMGASHSPSGYFKEGLALSTDLFRIGAILGAIYLAWRVTKGRRQESTPPWLRPGTGR